MKRKKLSSDAFQWAYDRYIGNDPKEIALYEKERVKADVAQSIYDLRNRAGLSRERLADLVGSAESVIEDLEEADYEGDFLGMASKIAAALHQRLEVRFVPMEEKKSAGAPG